MKRPPTIPRLKGSRLQRNMTVLRGGGAIQGDVCDMRLKMRHCYGKGRVLRAKTRPGLEVKATCCWSVTRNCGCLTALSRASADTAGRSSSSAGRRDLEILADRAFSVHAPGGAPACGGLLRSAEHPAPARAGARHRRPDDGRCAGGHGRDALFRRRSSPARECQVTGGAGDAGDGGSALG